MDMMKLPAAAAGIDGHHIGLLDIGRSSMPFICRSSCIEILSNVLDGRLQLVIKIKYVNVRPPSKSSLWAVLQRFHAVLLRL